MNARIYKFRENNPGRQAADESPIQVHRHPGASARRGLMGLK
jgi:hypothetical protein